MKNFDLNIRVIIKKLDVYDPLYLEKLDILYKLIYKSNIGHIISKNIVDWCKDVKLNPVNHQENGISWWTCSVKGELTTKKNENLDSFDIDYDVVDYINDCI